MLRGQRTSKTRPRQKIAKLKVPKLCVVNAASCNALHWLRFHFGLRFGSVHV